METSALTIEQFITKHGLKFECRPVASNPSMEASESMTRHFRCKISASYLPQIKLAPITKAFSVYFSQGSAHTSDPTLADVLDCLAGDASGYEDAQPCNGKGECSCGRKWDSSCVAHSTKSPTAHFENWASDYGYDADSRKAERTFKAIKRQSEQMKRTLGAEGYEELLYNTERL